MKFKMVLRVELRFVSSFSLDANVNSSDQYFSLARLVIRQAIGLLMDATKTRSCPMIKLLCVAVIT